MPFEKKPVSIKALISAAIPLFLVGGCMTPTPSFAPQRMEDRIQIAETIERLELYARPDGMVLSARDEMAVSGFLQNYGLHGDGPLYINVPAAGTVSQGVAQTQSVVRDLITRAGLNHISVQTGQYQTAMRGAPVVMSYRRLKTLPRQCESLSDLSLTYNNQAYDNFGCSYYANIAAMVSDTRQLLEPYAMGSPDMQRRSIVYDKYIEGDNPASEQPDRQQVSAGTEE